MTLQEFRKERKLTQKEASILVGIPYRTYMRYEEEKKYEGSFKYQKIIETLMEKTKVDEENGLLSVKEIKERIVPVLKQYSINYCYLFGSYARGEAKENSDVDLLIDTPISGFAFMNIIESLRTILHKKVDLVRLNDLRSDNPLVLQILKDGVRLI